MHTYLDFRPTRRLGGTAAVSPDGTMAAYADDTSGQFNLVIQDLTAGTREHVTNYSDATVRRAVWHPDGRSLLYLSDKNGNENEQIFRITIGDSKPEAVVDSPGVQHALALGDPVSPDGRWVAYTANDRSPGDQDVLLMDLQSGHVRRIYSGGGRVFAGYWSPDGKTITAAHWVEGNSDHIVYTVPVDGGPATRLTPGNPKATYWLGPWLEDGSGFLVRSNCGGEYTGLAVMDAATGKLTWLDVPDWDVDEVVLSGDGRVALWTVNVDGSTELRGRDMSTGEDLAVPALPVGVVDTISLSAAGNRAIMRMSTPTSPWNIVTVDLDRGEWAPLTDAVAAGVPVSKLVEPALVRFPTFDGRQIPAYLYRPSSAREPVGVVISIHGGPVFQERPVYKYEGVYQYLLDRGVAVLAPNVRGSDGYGKSYAQLVYRDWGGGDLQDYDAAMRYLQTLEWVDMQRIALWGGSYGGFLTLSCVSRLPDWNWAAAAVDFGPSNLVTLAKASPPTWRSKVAAVIGDWEEDAEFLLSRSPVTYADNIRTPLFVSQGVHDARVPRSESDQIVGRLRERGIEVEYLVFPDEGHGFTKAENQIKATTEAADFLLSHLDRARDER